MPALYGAVHCNHLIRRRLPTNSLCLGRRERALVGLADLLHARFPFRELLFAVLHRDAVELLNSAEQEIAPSRDHVELIVGELAPLLAHVALELLPVACDAIPVHVRCLRFSRASADCRARGATRAPWRAADLRTSRTPALHRRRSRRASRAACARAALRAPSATHRAWA